MLYKRKLWRGVYMGSGFLYKQEYVYKFNQDAETVHFCSLENDHDWVITVQGWFATHVANLLSKEKSYEDVVSDIRNVGLSNADTSKLILLMDQILNHMSPEVQLGNSTDSRTVFSLSEGSFRTDVFVAHSTVSLYAEEESFGSDQFTNIFLT